MTWGALVASKRKQRKQQVRQPSECGLTSTAGRRYWLFPFALGAVLSGGVALLAQPDAPGTVDTAFHRLQAEKQGVQERPSLGDLAAMPSKHLEQQDIAVLNLRCAEGLPGSETLDLERTLATLDHWVARVRRETERHLYKYRQNPKEFNNSEGFYRMMMLITVLQQDFKVHYNPDRIRDIDFRRGQDLFIHGMIGSDNGGTCVSMPVLYTAVARRLGYPVYLVTAKEHVFCRWDRGKERFNVEATAEGMSNFDDAYYMKWPKPIGEGEVKSGEYLKSLSVAESLAMFLAARGHCLEDNGSMALARVSYAQAAALSPRPIFQGFLVQSLGFPQSLPWQHATAQRRMIEPPMAYQPHGGQPDYHTPPNAVGYDTYQASKPMLPNMVGSPQSSPNGFLNASPDLGVWP